MSWKRVLSELTSVRKLWRSGLAGAIPAAAFFALGAAFLYAAVRRATGSRVAAPGLTGYLKRAPS